MIRPITADSLVFLLFFIFVWNIASLLSLMTINKTVPDATGTVGIIFIVINILLFAGLAHYNIRGSKNW
jgi:hypothetical protein